ncbi:hypothetical protein ACLKMH_14150 [Psychromonas sp. KJ10-10]|uniref:cytochrome b/b6 domain-containing protein n=1 Tax=Psychromonas sp. KJ10-10 TaxID=3391823 RepID=UPI0039B4A9E9
MKKTSLVWDIPLRIFHWLFATTILCSWFTIEQGYIDNHMLLGYFALGLVMFRVLWGFFGSKHSKFVSFSQHLKGYLIIFLPLKKESHPM